MGSKHSGKTTPFGLQSSRRKRHTYIDVKNRICRAGPILGGKFVTHDYMHGQNGWIDAFFLGRKAPLVYNLSLQTTRSAYKEAVWSHCWDLSYELAPERDPSVLDRTHLDPKTGRYVTLPIEPVPYPELDGLTRLNWVEAQCQIVANSGVVQVFEGWTLHADYAYGIGLHATIDVPFLTIEAVNQFVDRFLARPQEHRDPAPRSYLYAEIQDWGLESNAVIDPWDWAAAMAQSTEPADSDQISIEP
jgi:hypothetical protein